ARLPRERGGEPRAAAQGRVVARALASARAAADPGTLVLATVLGALLALADRARAARRAEADRRLRDDDLRGPRPPVSLDHDLLRALERTLAWLRGLLGEGRRFRSRDLGAAGGADRPELAHERTRPRGRSVRGDRDVREPAPLRARRSDLEAPQHEDRERAAA